MGREVLRQSAQVPAHSIVRLRPWKVTRSWYKPIPRSVLLTFVPRTCSTGILQYEHFIRLHRCGRSTYFGCRAKRNATISDGQSSGPGPPAVNPPPMSQRKSPSAVRYWSREVGQMPEVIYRSEIRIERRWVRFAKRICPRNCCPWPSPCTAQLQTTSGDERR